MGRLDSITSHGVRQAMAEFDGLGRDAFLERHGFRRARSYLLVHKGRTYDSKAIVGVAYGYDNPELGPLRSGDFSGGKSTVAARLEQLGFTVLDSVT